MVVLSDQHGLGHSDYDPDEILELRVSLKGKSVNEFENLKEFFRAETNTEVIRRLITDRARAENLNVDNQVNNQTCQHGNNPKTCQERECMAMRISR